MTICSTPGSGADLTGKPHHSGERGMTICCECTGHRQNWCVETHPNEEIEAYQKTMDEMSNMQKMHIAQSKKPGGGQAETPTEAKEGKGVNLANMGTCKPSTAKKERAAGLEADSLAGRRLDS